MNFLFEFNNYRLNFKKINIFYSYNGGGKTVFLKNFFEIIQNSAFQINSFKYTKKTFPSIFIEETENMNMLNKLTNKNILTSDYFNKINEDMIVPLKEKLKSTICEIQNNLNDKNNENILYYIDIEDIDSFIIKNTRIEFSQKYSDLRIDYFNTLMKQFNPKLIIIDNFDNGLNENQVNKFLNNCKTGDQIMLLSTSNPSSLSISLKNSEDIEIFVIRKNKLFCLNELFENFFRTNNNKDLNDFLFNENYNRIYFDLIKPNISSYSIYTIGRIFTNKDCVISNDINCLKNDSILIPYSNDFEYNMLLYINELLNDD